MSGPYRTGRHDVRQTIPSVAAVSVPKSVSAGLSPTLVPALLADDQAAQLLGVSTRKFHELRQEPWMPRPVVLGPRLVRWARTELEAAVSSMPRQQESREPAQLRRARIEGMKHATGTAGKEAAQ